MLSDLDRARLAILSDKGDRGVAMRGGQLPPLGTKRDSTTEMLYVVLMRIFGFYLVQAVFANWTTKNCNDLLWNRPRTTIEDQLRAHIKTANGEWHVSFPEKAECISPVFFKGHRQHQDHAEVASDSNKTFAAKFLAAICCRTCWREEDRSLDRISLFWLKIGLKSKKPKMPIDRRPQSVPTGDIVTQPGTKIVLNAPYDDKHTYHIKIVKINEILVLSLSLFHLYISDLVVSTVRSSVYIFSGLENSAYNHFMMLSISRQILDGDAILSFSRREI